MSASRHEVLRTLVRLFDRSDEPVTVDDLLGATDAPEGAIREYLVTFERCALIKRPADRDGVVPTVTARELLALDLDESSFVVLEPEDPE